MCWAMEQIKVHGANQGALDADGGTVWWHCVRLHFQERDMLCDLWCSMARSMLMGALDCGITKRSWVCLVWRVWREGVCDVWHGMACLKLMDTLDISATK